jgi:hypothetical protein
MGKALRKLILWSMAILVCVSLAGMISDYWPKQFARERWQSGRDIYRGSMVQDLVGSRVLVGRSRQEVIHLLGEPNQCFADRYSVTCTDQRADGFEYSFTARKCHLVWGCTLDVHFGMSSSVVDSVTVNDE